jgi:hypothetical protein
LAAHTQPKLHPTYAIYSFQNHLTSPPPNALNRIVKIIQHQRAIHIAHINLPLNPPTHTNQALSLPFKPTLHRLPRTIHHKLADHVSWVEFGEDKRSLDGGGGRRGLDARQSDLAWWLWDSRVAGVGEGVQGESRVAEGGSDEAGAAVGYGIF